MVIWSTCANEWFFSDLIKFMTSSEVIVFVVEGIDAIKKLNELVGASDPEKSGKDTIRCKYGISKKENTIHSSLNEEAYIKEYKLFFN